MILYVSTSDAKVRPLERPHDLYKAHVVDLTATWQAGR
jgi:hypothetical protein